MTLIAYLFLRLRPAKNVVRYMCKKSRFRLPFQKEHGKRVSALLKSERQHLYHIYWSMGTQLNCKKSLLVICKILRLFVNTFSGVDKYSLPNREYLMQPIQIKLSKKQKTFPWFYSAFSKSKLNFEHFQKKMTLITYLFLILRPAKNVVRYLCKKSRFRLPFQKEHAKRVSALLKSERQNLYHIYWSFGKQLNCKKSLLMIWKILRPFVKILNSVDKYSLPNREYLTQPIHIKLSQKQKTFPWLFSAFSKSKLNFEHFQKKDDPHSVFISEAPVCEKCG